MSLVSVYCSLVPTWLLLPIIHFPFSGEQLLYLLTFLSQKYLVLTYNPFYITFWLFAYRFLLLYWTLDHVFRIFIISP